MNINASPDTINRSVVSVTPGYMSGFGNSFETEALPGALPVGRNSPQRAPTGSTPSKCPARRSPRRAANERSGCTASARRCRHSGRFAKVDAGCGAPRRVMRYEIPIAQLRWDPTPIPNAD